MRNSLHCRRCDKTFGSAKSIEQHYENSARHYRCDVCAFDGSNWDGLVRHHRDTHHRIVCEGCEEEDRLWIPGSQEYREHLEDENVCTKCGRHFESSSNRDSHRLVHLSSSIECYGCTRMFTTYAGMIIHLESGACDSGIDILDLNESAAECFQWQKYLDGEYREDMLNCKDLAEEYRDTVYPFKCPTCEDVFSKLSGLFQHVNSTTCEQRLGKGSIAKLVKWLENKHS